MVTRKLVLPFLMFFGILESYCRCPRLVVIIVIDQFAAHYILKLDGYLSGGIHRLLKHGRVYANAFYPHAVLSTAVGHASLGTGALPGGALEHAHGIVANSWFDNNRVEHVFTAKSVNEIIIPPFTQRFLRANKNNRAVALSLKDRAALGMVGVSAPALWFDKEQNKFVSSKSDVLLSQIIKVGNARVRTPRQTYWRLAHSDERYYTFPFIDDYEYASDLSLFLSDSHQGTAVSRKKFLEVFLKLPDANKLVLDLARIYIENAYKKLKRDGSLLVWISLSSLDKLGHLYGPFSREVIDMIYHLDVQIDDFMQTVAKIAKPKDTFYVLTADHGVMPIPELIKPLAPGAQRILARDLIDEVNRHIKKKFNITRIIDGYKMPHIYLDQKKLQKCSPLRRELITEEISKKLSAHPGITRVFNAHKLAHTAVNVGTVDWLFKNNIFPGRSGDLLLHVAPYTIVSSYMTGTKHYTAYPYNTHVPLIMYQPKKYENDIIMQQVWVNQLIPTLAKIFSITEVQFPFAPLPSV